MILRVGLFIFLASFNFSSYGLDYFKFRIPAGKTYNSSIKLKGAEGYCRQDSSGIFILKTQSYFPRRKIYIEKDKVIVDSFMVNNIREVDLYSKDFKLTGVEAYVVPDSLNRIVENLTYRFIEEGKVIKEYDIRKLVIVRIREGTAETALTLGTNLKTKIIDFRRFFKYDIPRIDDVFLLASVKVWDAKCKRIIKVNNFKLTIVNPLLVLPSK
jgi:hypothetical protein